MRKASKMICNDCTIRSEPEEKPINLYWNITNSMERFKNENWVWYFALVRKIDIKQFGAGFSLFFSRYTKFVRGREGIISSSLRI